MIKELVRKSRSVRRFHEECPVTKEQLEELVDLGRLSPCGANKQYIKYVTVCTPEKNEQVYRCVAWAGYYKDWDGPEKGERPAAYIILLRDRLINSSVTVDEGIAAQSIFLGATDMGLGGCMMMNCDRKKLMEYLELDEDRFAISMVIALGVPKETVVIEEMKDDNVVYWRDENAVHHVPKRSLEEVLLKQE